MRVLIVDDSRAMQIIVRRGIEQLGYKEVEIRNAGNGLEAMDIIRAWEPNLVITDWHMPEMTGMEMLQSLNRQMLDTEVGFISTEDSEKRKADAFAAGARFFIQKPFEYSTLHEAVRPYLEEYTKSQKALEEEKTEKKNDEQQEIEKSFVKLPNLESLNKTLNHFSKPNLMVEETEPIALKEQNFPSLLGICEDPNTEKVCAVIILDLSATNIIGASVTSTPSERVHLAVKAKHIPKPTLANCKKVLETVATTLFTENDLTPLRLRSINAIRRNVEHMRKLLGKPADERLDVKITVDSYGTGKLSIIAS